MSDRFITDYKDTDFTSCVALVGRVWDFQTSFPSPGCADLMRFYYTSLSLAVSSHRRIVRDKGRVAGFLFGQIHGLRPAPSPCSGPLAGFLRFSLRVLGLPRLKLARKLKYVTMVLGHEVRRARIKLDEDAVVTLFVVDPGWQGKGLGKLLMDDFVADCRRNGAGKVVLETDEASNLGFYEHLGFRCVASFNSPMLEHFTHSSGLTLLYALELSRD